MIKAKFDPKYQMLLEAFDKELDQVKIIFDTDKVIWLVKKQPIQNLIYHFRMILHCIRTNHQSQVASSGPMSCWIELMKFIR